MRRGVTLVETLVVSVCMTVIIIATSSAVYTAITHTNKVKASRVTYDRNALFEDHLRSVLQNAYLSEVTTDTNSYFYGGVDVSDSGGGQSGSLGNQGNQNQLTFTALSPHIPSELVNDTNDDSKTLNDTYGPMGGTTEYSLGQTPIGNAPVESGLFLRKQTPADGDPSQGGTQSVFDPDIQSISFEFYDGTDWVSTWDTTQITPPRLPAAVRITYRRKNDTTDRLFVVRLVHSDVTPDNPVTPVTQ